MEGKDKGRLELELARTHNQSVFQIKTFNLIYFCVCVCCLLVCQFSLPANKISESSRGFQRCFITYLYHISYFAMVGID